MSIIVQDILEYMNKIAPLSTAEKWDNCGLSVGDPKQNVDKIMVALDPTMETIDHAIENKVNLIVTHHPLSIDKFNQVNTSSIEGKKIIRLIQNNIALYSAHTNLDQAAGGINDFLANKLHLNNLEVMYPTSETKLYKLVVYVPESHLEAVREALASCGTGHIGNYSNCFFYVEGTGTFKPEQGTKPYIGQQGQLERVREYRIETIVKEKQLHQALKAIQISHPYEEVAYDIYNTENNGEVTGFGRYGQLKAPISLSEYSELIKKELNLKYLQIVGNKNKIIKKVAVCSGSGMSFLKTAIHLNVDLFITGDIKYHDALNAKELGIGLMDASHFGTENIVNELLSKRLREEFPMIEIIEDHWSENPIQII